MRRLCSGLQFDGGNDYVTAGNGVSLNITGALTVEYWMKPTSLQETGGVNKYDLNNQRSWTVFPHSNGAIIWRVSSDGTANTLVDVATNANAYSAGVWSHVVATYTPSASMKIYVNGVESASLTTGVPASLYAAPTIPVYMGSYGQANGVPQTMFNGVLDEVRIYNRALSAAEVAARYQAQPEGQETLHYYLGGKQVAFKKGGTLYFPLVEHLGSTSVVTSSAGAVVESTAYYPYGATRTGAIATTEEQFTGQRLDSTGLYFYNARYYDPQIGRFISADTIVPSPFNPQALNRYTYVYDNPLRYTDPSGNCPLCVALVLVASNPRVLIAFGAAFGLTVAVNQTSYDRRVGYRPLPRPSFQAPRASSQNIFPQLPGNQPPRVPTPSDTQKAIFIATAATAGGAVVIKVADTMINSPPPAPTPPPNTPAVPQVVPAPVPQIVTVGPSPVPTPPTPVPSLPVEHVVVPTDPPMPSLPVIPVAPADTVDPPITAEPEPTVEQGSSLSGSSDDSFSWQDYGCFDENDLACF